MDKNEILEFLCPFFLQELLQNGEVGERVNDSQIWITLQKLNGGRERTFFILLNILKNIINVGLAKMETLLELNVTFL